MRRLVIDATLKGKWIRQVCAAGALGELMIVAWRGQLRNGTLFKPW